MAGGGSAVIGVEIEPARFAMTGSGLAFVDLRDDFSRDDAQAIDAPEFIATGGVMAGHVTHSGCIYVATSHTFFDRVRWS